jgi:hypothetical protein
MDVCVSNDGRTKSGQLLWCLSFLHVDKLCIRVRVGQRATILSMHDHLGVMPRTHELFRPNAKMA